MLELVLLLPSNPVLPCRAVRPSSGPLCCLFLPALLTCEECDLEMNARTQIEEHGLVSSYVVQLERLDVYVFCCQIGLRYPRRRERCRSLKSCYSSREVQRMYARSTMLKSPSLLLPKSKPLPMPKHTSCIEQVCSAAKLSYTLARHRLCIIAIVRP